MVWCYPSSRVLKCVGDTQVFSTDRHTNVFLRKDTCRNESRSCHTCCSVSDVSAVLSKEQMEFLERKRKGILPERSTCKTCDGIGTIPCTSCKGTGLNPVGLAEKMFTDERGIRQTNNIIDARWLLADNGPCWLCKGGLEIACKDCSGVGIPDILDKFSGD